MTQPIPLIITRRTLLGAVGGAAALLSVGARGSVPLPKGLFTLGVASGDPEPDGVILWTRLVPDPIAGDGGMPPVAVPVRWEVAEDEGFARIVRSGTAQAEPRWGHSVHVDANGLRPGRVYYYRFIAGGEVSPVARTRTAPARGAEVDRLRVCLASCQKYDVGFYAAYRHMVQDDPDLLLFVGDYIYETSSKKTVREHGTPEPVDLPGYRVRYATYKQDPLLQAAHHSFPWSLTWDDHEVANDYANMLDEKNSDPAKFLLRRAAAYQAFYEHQPIRAAAPQGPDMRIYRTLDWGRLAQFQIVDDRQYRAGRACQPPGLIEAHKQYQVLVDPCPDIADPNRSMLGKTQEAWLDAKFRASRAQWNLLTQQTLMHSELRLDDKDPNKALRYSTDNWSGYAGARDKIFRSWVKAGVSNPLALGGDVHSFVAADIRDPDRPDAAPIASEFVGGSITSLRDDKGVKELAAKNAFAFAENEVRGYGRLDITPKGGAVAFRGLADATREDSAIADIARFSLEAGRPGMHVESV